jgi:hypothetical protein
MAAEASKRIEQVTLQIIFRAFIAGTYGRSHSSAKDAKRRSKRRIFI